MPRTKTNQRTDGNIKSTGTLRHVLHCAYSTDYYCQRLSLKSWFTNLEQTPLNRSQQVSATYKGLIDGFLLRNSHCQQQSYAGLRSLGRSRSIYSCCYYYVGTFCYIFHLYYSQQLKVNHGLLWIRPTSIWSALCQKQVKTLVLPEMWIL